MLLSWVAISDGGPGAVDALEQQHDVGAGVRVEVAGGLVRQQRQRPVDEGAGDRDPLLLAAGQLVGQPLCLPFQADQLEDLGNDLLIVARDRPITSRANPTLSSTVLLGSSRKSWKTQPTGVDAQAPWTAANGRSFPSTSICPRVGTSSRITSRRNVDLPEPEGPIRKANSPLSTSMVTSSRAGLVEAL